MKNFSFFILAICIICACGEDVVVNNDVPSTKFVPRSSDTATYETGIRAWPDVAGSANGGIRLEWFSNRDIGGYNLYRTTKLDSLTSRPTDFQKIARIPYNETIEDTGYVDTDIELNKEYHYLVRAYDRSLKQTEGKNSDTVSFLMEGQISLIFPIDTITVADSIRFRWNGNPGYSVIRVYEVPKIGDGIIRPVWVYGSTPISFAEPYFTYGTDGKAIKLQKDKSYKWRVTRVFPGSKARGSASGWKRFTVK